MSIQRSRLKLLKFDDFQEIEVSFKEPRRGNLKRKKTDKFYAVMNFPHKRQYRKILFAVHVYPSGHPSLGNDDYISVMIRDWSLKGQSVPGMIYESMSWTISMVDEDGVSRFLQSFSRNDFAGRLDELGLKTFVRRSKLMDKEVDDVVLGENFTIRCEVSYMSYTGLSIEGFYYFLYASDEELKAEDDKYRGNCKTTLDQLVWKTVKKIRSSKRLQTRRDQYKKHYITRQIIKLVDFSNSMNIAIGCPRNQMKALIDDLAKKNKQIASKLLKSIKDERFREEMELILDLFHMSYELFNVRLVNDEVESTSIEIEGENWTVLTEKNGDFLDRFYSICIQLIDLSKFELNCRSSIEVDIQNKFIKLFPFDKHYVNETLDKDMSKNTSRNGGYHSTDEKSKKSAHGYVMKFRKVCLWNLSENGESETVHKSKLDAEMTHRIKNATADTFPRASIILLFVVMYCVLLSIQCYSLCFLMLILFRKESKGVQKYVKDRTCKNSKTKSLVIRTKHGETCFIPYQSTLLEQLRAASPVIDRMLSIQMQEKSKRYVEMPDISCQTLKAFVCHVTTGRLRVRSLQEIYHLYEMADKYEALDLMQVCAKCMELLMSIQNFKEIRQCAVTHSDEYLLKSVEDFENEISVVPIGQNSEPQLFSAKEMSLDECDLFNFYQ